MPQIEFYSIQTDSETDEANKASRLPIEHIVEVITRGYRKNQRIFIHAESKKQAEMLDEKLWTQNAKSFLPHQLVGEDENTTPPIEIGYGQNPSIRADILINLADEVPTFYSGMKWIFEYAYGDNDKKESAREKFRFYRQQNCVINHKQINPESKSKQN